VDRRWRGEEDPPNRCPERGIHTNFDGTPDVFAHKSSVLQGHCKDLGRDFSEITRSANYNVVIGADQAEVDTRLEWFGDHYRAIVGDARADKAVEDARSGPAVGTPDQIIEALTAAQEMGMTYAICYFAEAAYDRSGIELFESEVAPALR